MWLFKSSLVAERGVVRVVQEGGGGLGEREREREGMGGQQMVCHAARDVGCHGWKGGVGAVVGADKWVWEGGTFPQSASRDDEEGD